jgi:hypothetical protein
VLVHSAASRQAGVTAAASARAVAPRPARRDDECPRRTPIARRPRYVFVARWRLHLMQIVAPNSPLGAIRVRTARAACDRTLHGDTRSNVIDRERARQFNLERKPARRIVACLNTPPSSFT